VTPANSIYTGGIATNIYLGYGPQSAGLGITAGGGGTGYSYAWSPATYLDDATIANPVFTPTAGGTYTYAVTVTNSSGCQVTSQSISFCVKNIQVPGTTDKVYICHVPTGNTSNPQTLAVSTSAVASHLSGHDGDALGACDQTCGSTGARLIANARNEVGEDVKVYPNPNKGAFILELPYFEGKAFISITDVSGKALLRKDLNAGDDPANKFRLDLGDVARGMYFLEVHFGHDSHYYKTKIVVQ
jgi:hypothetical protein